MNRTRRSDWRKNVLRRMLAFSIGIVMAFSPALLLPVGALAGDDQMNPGTEVQGIESASPSEEPMMVEQALPENGQRETTAPEEQVFAAGTAQDAPALTGGTVPGGESVPDGAGSAVAGSLSEEADPATGENVSEDTDPATGENASEGTDPAVDGKDPGDGDASGDTAAKGKNDDENAEEAANVAEDGIYRASFSRTSAPGEKTVLYVTVRAGRITALRVLAAADSGADQETWDALTATVLQKCAGIPASPGAMRERTFALQGYPEEQQELAALLWETIPQALSGEKLSPEAERDYLQQIRETDARTDGTDTDGTDGEGHPEKQVEEIPVEGISIEEIPEEQKGIEAPEEEDPEEQKETETPGEEDPEEQKETEASGEEVPEERETEKASARAARGPRRVSGAQVAADGTYSALVTVTKRKDSGKTKYYYGTVYVTVSDGVISNLMISASDKQSRFQDLLDSVKSNYIGQTATANVGVDATSSASVGGSGSTSSKYTSNLVDAIRTALASAPVRSGSSDASDLPDGVYTGTGKMTGNDHYITLRVTVKDGKIAALEIADADGSWDSLLSQVSPSYINGSADEQTVDAVTSATPQGYRVAIADAIKDALRSTASDPGSGESPDPEEPDPEPEDTWFREAESGKVVVGQTFKGNVILDYDTQITFQNCTFQKSILPRDETGIAILENVRFVSSSGYGLSLATNLLRDPETEGDPETESEVNNLQVSFPLSTGKGSSSGSATLQSSSLVYTPGWAKNKYDSTNRSYRFSGITPEDAGYQSFSVNVAYTAPDGGIDFTVPLILNVVPRMTTLTISAETRGTEANTDKSFDYRLRLSPADAEGFAAVTPTVKSSADARLSADTALPYDKEKGFSLKDNQSIVLQVPLGTKYTLIAEGDEEYQITAQTGGPGTDTQNLMPQGDGKDLTVTGIAGPSADNRPGTEGYRIALTNTLNTELPPQSGVKDTRVPWLLGMILSVTAMAAWEVLCRRKRA